MNLTNFVKAFWLSMSCGSMSNFGQRVMNEIVKLIRLLKLAKSIELNNKLFGFAVISLKVNQRSIAKKFLVFENFLSFC